MKDCNKYITFGQSMKRLFRNKAGVGISEWLPMALHGEKEKDIENAARLRAFILTSGVIGEVAELPAYGIKNL